MTTATIEISDQRLRSTFFRSITLLTSSAGIILCGSEGRLFPSALTPLFAVLGWILVDQLRWLRVHVLVGNVLGLIALGAAMTEFLGGTLEQKLLSGAHLIVYMTWIVLLMPKAHRQYWWLIALSLLQLAISGVLQTGVGFGAAMFSMMLLLLWTMSVFSLYRVQDQHSARRTEALTGQREILIRNGLQKDPSEVWVGWRFRWMVLGSYFVSLLLAVFVFAAFPRVWFPGVSLFGRAEAASAGFRSRSGFRESIELGFVGQLMLSNERVLTFSIADRKSGDPVSPEVFAAAMNMDEVRFRGNALSNYSRGLWTRANDDVDAMTIPGVTLRFLGGADLSGPTAAPPRQVGKEAPRVEKPIHREADFLVEIVQDPPIGDFAFAPYPVIRARSLGPFQIRRRQASDALIWSTGRDSARPASRSFVVECVRPEEAPAAALGSVKTPEDATEALSTTIVSANARTVQQANIPGDLSQKLPQLYRTARELCTADSRLVPADQRIDRVLKYLSHDNGFVYSLNQTRQNRSQDPVEDFLLNSKSGHCEYFASACTLMLQAVNVPARIVNGYYGSEVNALTGKHEVRQRHAHAWVEAFVNGRWQTVEPTPASERREELTSSRPVSLMSDFQTAISDLWNDGVHRMSAERQREFFAPVIATSKNLYQSIVQHGLWDSIKTSFRTFITSPKSWFSWQGGAVMLVLIVMVLIIRRFGIIQRLTAILRSFRHRFSRQHRAAQSVIRFYAGFCLLCRRHGLTIPPAHSALENGRAAMRTFSERLQSPELQDLPLRIAHAFNEVRFGSVTLSDDEAERIGRDLHAFAEALQSMPSLTATG